MPPYCSAAWSVVSRISSLLQNPASGGIPASDSAPITIVMKVIGIRERRPPIRRMSWAGTTWARPFDVSTYPTCGAPARWSA
jgi:hypothetical protein